MDPARARHRLDVAAIAVERRERLVDRRSTVLVQLADTGSLAAMLGVAHWLAQQEPSGRFVLLIALMAVWGQLSSGVKLRGDRGLWRWPTRWAVVAGSVTVTAVAGVVFLVTLANRELIGAWGWFPPVLVLVCFGGYGIAQLVRVSGGVRAAPSRPAPLPRGARIGTLALGGTLGAATIAFGVPAGPVSIAVSVVLVLGLLILVLAVFSPIGLLAVGSTWRWPHFFAFGAAALSVVLFTMVGDASPAMSVIAGLGVIVLFVAVSFVPGRADDA